MRLAFIVAVSLFFSCTSVEEIMPAEYHGEYVPFDKLVLKKYSSEPLIWGAKITAENRAVVKDVSIQILADANDLMACMAWEGNREFSPSTKNFAGSSGTGMIQVMFDTVKHCPEILRYCQGKMDPDFVREAELKHQVLRAMDIIAGMTFPEYMYHVAYPYFKPYRGRIGNLPDLYMSILRPASIGRPMSSIMFIDDLERHKDAYDMNCGLDANGDHVITKAEACAPVIRIYEEGKKWMK
jgi:hypothetical protein